MHAARAINKNREKREDKKQERRHSGVSQITWTLPRSPAVSIDQAKRRAQQARDDEKGESGSEKDVESCSGSRSLLPISLPPPTLHRDDDQMEAGILNFSYIGFIIAVFGAVPLLVGTFVEVPALWEIGLGVTLVGLLIGIVFWCTELCAEAKKLSQKKKGKLSNRKVEDSNLLQVPDRHKFHGGGGVPGESRRDSFQSDSVSLITPTAQQYERSMLSGSPNHLNHLNLQNNDILSQYSSTKSDESSATTLQYYGSIRNNGNIIGPGPPRLLLRGNGRKDDSRVASLVQPDPGLSLEPGGFGGRIGSGGGGGGGGGGDSDSDAETVIEAPTGRTKVIHVQTQSLVQDIDRDSFRFEDETQSTHSSGSLLSQHRTIRMPVMPQEVEKLQKCECGRYLLTERDKLLGIKLSKIGTGDGCTIIYDSPTLAVPQFKKAFNSKGELLTPDSTTSSEGGGELDDLTPQSPDPPEMFSVITAGGTLTKKERPTVTGDGDDDEFDSHNYDNDYDSDTLTRKSVQGQAEPEVEAVMMTSISTEVLCTTASETKTDNNEIENENEIYKEVTEAATSSADAPSPRRLEKEKAVASEEDNGDEEDEDKLLDELLELTNENLGQPMRVVTMKVASAKPDTQDEDDEFADSHKKPEVLQAFETDEQEDKHPPIRPTYLALPVMLTETAMLPEGEGENNDNQQETAAASAGLITSSSSCSSNASTVVFLGGSYSSEVVMERVEEEEARKPPILVATEVQEEEVLQKGKISLIKTEMSSLDELLDKCEGKKQDDVLAVVVS